MQEAVSNVLRRVEPDVEIAVAGDCENGLEIAVQGAELDLVLLDLNLPGLSGIPALKLWRTRFPGIPIVILSATVDQPTVLAAIGAGAAGFIPKSSSNEVMQSALRLVLAGGKYLPQEVLTPSRGGGSGPGRLSSPAELSTETLGLTARQIEVLRMIAKGASNKVICRELGLAERTVKAHVTAILRALKVSSRTQAAIEAGKLGVFGPVAGSARHRDDTGA
jgi:DNA-binding NarL/FixJ family response regulator